MAVEILRGPDHIAIRIIMARLPSCFLPSAATDGRNVNPAVAVPSSCCGWEPMLDEPNAEIFRSIRASGRPPAPTAEARPLAPPAGDRARSPCRLGRHDLCRSRLLPHGLSEPASDLAPRLAFGPA